MLASSVSNKEPPLLVKLVYFAVESFLLLLMKVPKNFIKVISCKRS